VKFFSDDLPADALEALRSRMVTRRFARGETIVHQGDPSTNVYLIDTGHASVRIGTANGLTLTVGVLGPDESFGEMAALAGEGLRTASVVAIDTVTCHIIATRDFDQLRSENREIDRHLVGVLASLVIELDQRLTQAAYESVQRRCARRLYEVALLFADLDTDTAKVPLTQEELGSMAGATRSTTNQALSALSSQRVIALSRGRTDVLSLSALKRYLGWSAGSTRE
jgi:CRP/FNR family cyclic AMP-dependent transcriptional regulator